MRLYTSTGSPFARKCRVVRLEKGLEGAVEEITAVFPYKEYSEVFFGPDYKVLRGGAFGVDPVAARGTFRNWDYPIRRQIFSGFRTARDTAPGEAG